MSAAVVALLLLSGMRSGVAQDGAASDTITFPDPASAWQKQGNFISLDILRNVAIGQSKSQLYNLLGQPHFNEGFFGVRVWNYLFSLRDDGSVIQCQLQIHFDDNRLVKAMYWRDSACADIVATARLQ